MAVHITDAAMTSDLTRITARRGEDGWVVSWLPGRTLGRNEALTALTLAETVAIHDLHADNPMWDHVDGWAAELDLAGPDAVARIAVAAMLAPAGADASRLQTARVGAW